MLLLTTVLERVGINLVQYLGLYYFKSSHFYPYQFITHLFMHGNIMHLFFNMWMLFMFGVVLERIWGTKRFLIYYFVTGIGAALLHTFVNWVEISQVEHAAAATLNTLSPDTFSAFCTKHFSSFINPTGLDNFLTDWSENPENQIFTNEAEKLIHSFTQRMMNTPTVGASGAVYGVLLAFGMLFPNTRLMLLFPPIPVKAKYMVMFCIALELFLGVSQPGSNIAHFAHVGGMLFGYLLLVYWRRKGNSLY
jgi:membrane associated rhomboid family serine protease